MDLNQSLPLSPGIILKDRYRVGDCINSGNQGLIFNIEDLEWTKYSVSKVVKVAPFSPDTEKKFKTEAEKLSQCNHPGLPKIEDSDAYFKYFDKEKISKFCCLVMEKIDGQNLDAWLKERDNKPIGEKRAIAWLKQLIDILSVIHAKDFWHRDIKPQNIMLKPDGQLVLIDFGVGREATESFHLQQQRGSGTITGTSGYHAPEQFHGRSSRVSDFYSVGCTLVHLLTGIEPTELPQSKPYKLSWRRNAIHTSEYLADLVDDLMLVDEKKRDRCIQKLSKRIFFLETLPLKGRIIWRELPWVFGLGLLSSVFWVGIRLLGLLQPLELMAYDWMMRSRPLEEPDPRLVIITIDDEDIEYQRKKKMQFPPGDSLSDEAFSLVVKRISQYPNSVIGLDLIREHPTDPQFYNLIDEMKGDRLIMGCQHINVSKNHSSYRSPPEANLVGFADMAFDAGQKTSDVLRRHLLLMGEPDGTPCKPGSEYALSTLLSIRYLHNYEISNSISRKPPTRRQLIIGNINFQNLANRQGPYQNLDERIQDIMLNYRVTRLIADVGQRVSLKEVLNERFDSSIFEDKIILIGGISGDIDRHDTPVEKNVPGLYLHGHMISQIISHVLDDRPLIMFWDPIYDFSLIIITSIISIFSIWLGRLLYIQVLLVIGASNSILVLSIYLFLWQVQWFPLVPVILTIVSSLLLKRYSNRFIRLCTQIY